MSIRERLSGNEAAATAMKQINPDVVAAFPITPSTEIPQYFSTFVANGTVDTEFVAVESEHSAMSACIGAEAAGARAMTATSANGLSLMWEMIYIASSLRLPIVLSLVNRAVSGPLNIHCDHSDAMGVRDAGWIMLFSETNQEAYDNTLMAHRIAEHKDVMLPLMVCQDGFITSHAIENIEFTEASRELVRQYSEKKMGMKAYEDVSQRTSNIAAQQKIAQGIQDNGFGNVGGMIMGMNVAQGLGAQAEPKQTLSFDQQIETLKKLKELLDAGILSKEEFDAKKKEIMGL